MMSHLLSRSLPVLASALALAAVSAPMQATSVAAQGLIFDWGGEKTADSGKQSIKFSGPAKPGDIIVSFGDRKLYFFTAPGEADTYPIAIPREQSRWEGVTTVSMKRENPSWTPTAHMLAENPKLPRWVPGGHPMNPLGNRAMYLGSSDYRIHGTDAPWTIGSAASKGCVRMFNKDVADLYPRVKVGSKVTVTWQKFDGKTLAIADNAKPVSDPDSSPQNRAQLASYAPAGPADDGKATKSRARKPADIAADESRTPSGEKVEKAKASADDEPLVKRKWSRPAAATSEIPAAALANEQIVKAKRSKPAEPAEAASEPASQSKAHATAAEAAPAPAIVPERRVKTARAAKPDADVVSSGSERASLAVAERALAAAERAAAAAERAAAAAERAVAASNRTTASSSDATATKSVVAQ